MDSYTIQAHPLSHFHNPKRTEQKDGRPPRTSPRNLRRRNRTSPSYPLPQTITPTNTTCPQDFAGQSLAELLTYTLLSLSGIIAFFVGFSSQDIYKTLYIGGAGTILTFLLVVPPWPYFNRKPEKWLPARTGRQSWNVEVDGKKVG